MANTQIKSNGDCRILPPNRFFTTVILGQTCVAINKSCTPFPDAAQEKRRTVNLTSNVCFVKKENSTRPVCGDHKRTRRSKKVGKVENLPLVWALVMGAAVWRRWQKGRPSRRLQLQRKCTMVFMLIADHWLKVLSAGVMFAFVDGVLVFFCRVVSNNSATLSEG